MSKKIVEIKGLKKNFGKIKAVDNLDLEVWEGDIFGLLGPNGAGKSTTIRMMLSLIKADAGSISILGMPLRSNRNEILKDCGCLIERADFYTFLSAFDNMRLLADISGKGVDKKDIMNLLETVGLQERSESKVKTFSQGMKQRLGIAQALVGKPKLLVLDEPTNGLDPQGMKEMRNLILRLNKELGITIILSSHILSEVELLANRMVIINKGKTVVSGLVDELLNAGILQVIVKSDAPQKVEQIARDLGYDAAREGDDISIPMLLENIPILTEALSVKQIKIYGIIPKRSLESYFLSLT